LWNFSHNLPRRASLAEDSNNAFGMRGLSSHAPYSSVLLGAADVARQDLAISQFSFEHATPSQTTQMQRRHRYLRSSTPTYEQFDRHHGALNYGLSAKHARNGLVVHRQFYKPAEGQLETGPPMHTRFFPTRFPSASTPRANRKRSHLGARGKLNPLRPTLVAGGSPRC